MVGDQRFAAQRPDVLVYQTGPLEADMTLVGPADVRLFVSTTGTDSDWVVKLIDVYPDEYPEPTFESRSAGRLSATVRGRDPRSVSQQPLRARPPRPRPAHPRVFGLRRHHPRFRTGHPIMVQVQSTWFPLVDRNPQTFVEIAAAKEIRLPESHPARLSHARASLASGGSGTAALTLDSPHSPEQSIPLDCLGNGLHSKDIKPKWRNWKTP